jgi:hypothetical protein
MVFDWKANGYKNVNKMKAILEVPALPWPTRCRAITIIAVTVAMVCPGCFRVATLFPASYDGAPPETGSPASQIDGGYNDGGYNDGSTSEGSTSEGGTSEGGTSEGGTPEGGTPEGGTPDGDCAVDTDGDGTNDCSDSCPNDANKTAPLECGCGVAETGDTDGDGVHDCEDGCPFDAAKTDPGNCGCLVAEDYCHLSTAAYSRIDGLTTRVCGIRASDHHVFCNQDDAEFRVPSGVPFSKVSVGERQFEATPGACGIREADGRLQCWGQGPAPPPALDDVAFDDVVMGSGDLRVALRRDNGFLEDWATKSAPTNIAFNSITATTYYACGVRRGDNKIQCWGNHIRWNDWDTQYSSISCNYWGCCGRRLSDSEIYCGSGTGPNVAPEGVEFLQVDARGQYACGIRASDEEVQCWNSAGDAALSNMPVRIRFLHISSVRGHACGIRKADGRVQCWGNGGLGGWPRPLP